VATALVTLYTARYKDTPCPVHLPRQPTAKTATEFQATHPKETI
jgi:hypothetical protein